MANVDMLMMSIAVDKKKKWIICFCFLVCVCNVCGVMYIYIYEYINRIPRDIMHSVPTTLLHSLEGMTGLEWEKLLKLQSRDGSFLFSPSSTAFALIQTRDPNCFDYLSRAVHKFNGGGIYIYI